MQYTLSYVAQSVYTHKAWPISTHQDSFTYYEMIDLFVGMKLSGELDNPGRKHWKRIRKYCYILRLNGKSEEQMRMKYRHYTIEDRYSRYFTPLFHNTVIQYNPDWEPMLTEIDDNILQN